MLKVVFRSQSGLGKVQFLRFFHHTRQHFSGTMSMSEDLQDELFTLDSPNSSIKESNARTGKLTLKGRNVIETPNFLAITSRGAVPHITPDVMLEHTGIRGVHISLEDCKFEVALASF